MLQRITVLMLCACLVPVAGAQDSATTPQDEIIARILELQRQIEQLMATLPPDDRAELRARLAEVGAQQPSVAAPTAPEARQSTEPTTVKIVEPATVKVVEPATVEVVEPAKTETASPTTVDSPVIAAGPSAIEAPVPTAPAAKSTPISDGIPKLIKRRSRRTPCNTLSRFDENGDGKINSADRFWRHVYLWTDRNGDRQIQDREVKSAYELKVREIAVSLETFIHAKGSLGEMRVEDQVVLDLRGDGFSERSRRDDGILVVDVDALGRGDGPSLLGPGGEPLSGFQPFRSGMRLEMAGETTALNCP